MAKKASKKSPAKKKVQAKKPAAKRSAPARRAAVPRKPSYRPEGLGDVIAQLVYKNASAAIDFYKNAFGAKELRRFKMPDGKIGHSEIKIGDTVLFMVDESPMMQATMAATPEHKATFSLQLYMSDVDAAFNRAVQAGAKPAMPVMDMFWGDRMGQVIDPFGQSWSISTRAKLMTDEQMQKAGDEFMKQMAQQPPGQPQSMPPPATPAASFS